MGLLKTCLVGAIVLVGLTAFTGAPSRSFTQDGVDYRWMPLAGASRGALVLLQLDDAGRGAPVAMLTCDDQSRGGIEVRDAAASDRLLNIAVGDKVFAVRGARRDVGDIASVQGHGAFPHEWLAALGDAETVTIAYGAVQQDFPGPGEAVTARYIDDCRRLG